MSETQPGETPGGSAAGEEPEEESGAGYGNHAPPEPVDESSKPDKDGR